MYAQARQMCLTNQFRTKSNTIGLCSVQVLISSPNRFCVKSREVIQTFFIPLGAMDQNGIRLMQPYFIFLTYYYVRFPAIVTQQNGILRLMSKIYGRQTVMASLIFGVNFMMAVALLCAGCGCLSCRVSYQPCNMCNNCFTV